MTPQDKQGLHDVAEDLAIITAAIVKNRHLKINIDDAIDFYSYFQPHLERNLKLSDVKIKDAAIVSTFDLLEASAKLTETQADDKFLKVARTLYEVFSINKPWRTWIDNIQARRQSKRAARKLRKAK